MPDHFYNYQMEGDDKFRAHENAEKILRFDKLSAVEPKFNNDFESTETIKKLLSLVHLRILPSISIKILQSGHATHLMCTLLW